MGAFGCSGDDDCDYSFGVDDIDECGLLADQLFCDAADFTQDDDCDYNFGDVENVNECETIADQLFCEIVNFDQEAELCVVTDCICEDGFCLLQDCICDSFDDDDF